MKLSEPKINERLKQLRASMLRNSVDACLVLSSDPHVSEYIPKHWQVRQWLSGFYGSAATLVITQEFAGIWTDSRYWEQADHDMHNTGYTVMHSGKKDVPSPIEWLIKQCAKGQNIWLDQRVVPVQNHNDWQAQFSKHGLNLCHSDGLIDQLWSDRPALPNNPVYQHVAPFACRTITENLHQIRATMNSCKAHWHLISALDDIAWLFNLRGSDVEYNPVFLAHALIGVNSTVLFTNLSKIDSNTAQSLASKGVTLQPYENINAALSGLPEGETILFDPVRTTYALIQAAQHLNLVQQINPSQLLKAQKNTAEIENIRRTMEYDGAALCEFFCWFESAFGTQQITELTVDERITAARAKQPGFVSPSFGTIAGFNANGALPHYQATQNNHSVIEGDGLLLIDSGGQYLGGTTDITRVIPIGNISEQQRADFTLVLKGMIALSQAHFPEGTTGASLDAIARMPMWQQGLDYGHGTGHGVGYFMNVHEGPQSISQRVQAAPHFVLRAGMVTSNEPGLYRSGKWGIRIENLVLTTAAQETEFNSFLKFETLTLCPIDTRCINLNMLSDSDKHWLNSYHDEVRNRLAPLLTGNVLEWLLKRTSHV